MAAPLPENQHAFDNAHLRAFAHRLPWWFRPQEQQTQFCIDDFIADVRSRLSRHFGEKSNEGRLIHERNILGQHLGFQIAEVSLRAKVGYGIDFVLRELRVLLDRIVTKKHIPIPQTDPLYAKGYGQPAESTWGMPIRLLKATQNDLALIEACKGKTLEHLIEGPLQPYCICSPQTRYILYCHDLRRRLSDLVAPYGDEAEDNRWREGCVDPIIDEWIQVRGAAGSAEHLDSLTAQVGFQGDVLNADVGTVMKEVIHPLTQGESATSRSLPLVEEILLVLTQRRDTKGLLTIGPHLRGILDRYHIPICDHPGLGLAYLAVNALVGRLKDFRLRLGP